MNGVRCNNGSLAHGMACLSAIFLAVMATTSAWGATKSQEAATKPEPLEDPGRWFGPDDYPLAASLDGLEGKTTFKLDVGPDGRVTSCTITSAVVWNRWTRRPVRFYDSAHVSSRRSTAKMCQ